MIHARTNGFLDITFLETLALGFLRLLNFDIQLYSADFSLQASLAVSFHIFKIEMGKRSWKFRFWKGCFLAPWEVNCLCLSCLIDKISYILDLWLLWTIYYPLQTWSPGHWWFFSAWPSFNLGEILWRGTRCGICNWCCLPFTFWRFKNCSRQVIWNFWIVCHSQSLVRKVGICTTSMYSYLKIFNTRKGSSAWGFARSATFDTSKQTGNLFCYISFVEFSNISSHFVSYLNARIFLMLYQLMN